MPKCENCKDTGSQSKSLYGLLDCTHCDVAQQRAELDAWVRASEEISTGLYWTIFQRGVLAGLAQAKEAGQ